MSKPCSIGGGDMLDSESASAHECDLAALEELADRFGFQVGDGKPHDLFREPDAVRKALLQPPASEPQQTQRHREGGVLVEVPVAASARLELELG